MRIRVVVVSCSVGLLVPPSLVLASAPVRAADPVPPYVLGVDAASSISPAFDPAVRRYTLRAPVGPDGTGQATVSLAGSAPGTSVRVDGVPATGPTTVTGLEIGEEVSVLVDDAGGTTAYALVYVPPEFPVVSTVVHEPGAGAEHLLLTLTDFFDPAATSYEVALDRNSVPAHVRALPAGQRSVDLKPAPGGHYSVMRSRGQSPGGVGDWDLVELDERFREVRTLRTVGLQNTDSHESILRPDGSRLLVAYEYDAATQLVDSVIQDVSASGEVLFEWNSADHFLPGETVAAADDPDYAHLNSVVETADGNLLVSFRHTSSVMKIARFDQGEFEEGDVMWRLGGRYSDFAFPDDPAGTGPCAQHTATEVADGHVLIYDNGSSQLGASPSYCLDQEDGSVVQRPATRVVEYLLDEEADTATTAWSYQAPARYAYFAGSAYRGPDGRTVIGWASALQALASEVDADGRLLWENAVGGDSEHITYRAHAHAVVDATPPTLRVTAPAEGASYEVGSVVVPAWSCADAGGSTLRTCTVPAALDTSVPGVHAYQVSATDGAGNTTTVSRTYRVVPRPAVHRVDLRLGRTTMVLPRRGAERTVALRVHNRGTATERVRLRGRGVGPGLDVSYRYDGRRVPVTRGWRTPALAPGESLTVRIRVRRTTERTPRAALRLSARGTAGRTTRVVLRLRG